MVIVKTKKLKFKEHVVEEKQLKLDLGAGKGGNTPEGFIPVDKIAFKGIMVVDLSKKWPWKNNSVDEARCSYMVHYLTTAERVNFINELYRVLKPGASCQIITPYWCANRAYADIQVQWPPVVEGWYPTLSKAWRDSQNAVDMSGMTCNFDQTLGYGMHPMIIHRNEEYKQHAVAFWKEAAQDLIATVTKV